MVESVDVGKTSGPGDFCEVVKPVTAPISHIEGMFEASCVEQKLSCLSFLLTPAYSCPPPTNGAMSLAGTMCLPSISPHHPSR